MFQTICQILLGSMLCVAFSLSVLNVLVLQSHWFLFICCSVIRSTLSITLNAFSVNKVANGLDIVFSVDIAASKPTYVPAEFVIGALNETSAIKKLETAGFYLTAIAKHQAPSASSGSSLLTGVIAASAACVFALAVTITFYCCWSKPSK